MLTSRKALLSNLNYVHLQHVSLGVHLSMHSKVSDTHSNQDTGLKDGCQHKWKDTTMVDPNSNDPTMPCHCCDQHPGQEASSQYSSLEDLDTIICDECLSPDDLPLSPLSLSSPSTDSSSSSDFTLDDSPASMYYKEYSQDGLDTPDQQPDIIPLDAATEGPFSSGEEAETKLNANASEAYDPEITNNNNMEAEDTPFIDWGSDSMVDSNSNTILERSGSSSMDSDTIAEPKVQINTTGQAEHWPVDLLPGLPVLDNTSTPKKTITSFHELALRRRRSGGGQLPSQPKKDRSDWLITFSPDTEQPPINELTASAFYHGILEPQTHPKPAGKEVTTFRELRYRNTLNKQSVQQMKVNEETPNTISPEAATEPSRIGEVLCAAWEPNIELETAAKGECSHQTEGSEPSNSPACRSGPQTERDLTRCGPIDTPSPHRRARYEGISDNKEAPTVAWIRGMADGGDRRALAAECELYMADDGEDSVERQKKSLLIAVGSSVDKIISHFNTSRNQVQKAQLGDSRLSPVLGYLILNHLCPSLYSLLGDGLKPYQKDVIIGRRRLSPWSLAEASTKTGPETVHLLFSKVNRLAQLRDPQRKFNAFIFGLLNMKQLDVWVLHLHQSYDELCSCYLPSGFLALAATSHVDLRDELLLILQPLSALTFHTDLLFEHHHLSLQDPPTTHRAHGPGRTSDNWAAPSLQNILDLGGWITHNLTWNAENKTPFPKKRKSVDSPEDTCSAQGSQPGDPTQTSPDLTSNWWGHLGQASQIYTPANRESVGFFTLRKLTSWGAMDKELNQRAVSSKERASPEQRLNKEMSSGGASKGTANGKEQDMADMEQSDPGTPDRAGAERVKTLPSMEGGSQEKGHWLGQLFGANPSQSQEMEARNSKSRRPSSWLPPNVNVWNLIKKHSTLLKHEEEEPKQREDSRTPRSLRALCDHNASGKAQLSFKKGEVLQLLGTVDEDWIQCRRGSDTGLVPVGYTSLIL